MATTTQTKRERRNAAAMLRDLMTTVALCYLITLGLLRGIALHLELFAPSASCGVGQAEHSAYQRALANVSHTDVLKVTTACSVAAFAAVELCILVGRRARIRMQDAETACGIEFGGIESAPEKQLEKIYFEIVPRNPVGARPNLPIKSGPLIKESGGSARHWSGKKNESQPESATRIRPDIAVQYYSRNAGWTPDSDRPVTQRRNRMVNLRELFELIGNKNEDGNGEVQSKIYPSPR
ncbi:hypothetical protein B0H17DRAFT_1278968 [Mycena rosella]|uniref:Uncharacterized protein n=1 Tax=Mycena rosella TaxID=1033263 RepID=A0AAD7C2N2_MYCRO|nr:hypothetical protein B0H17DRAFT_1278968 [Mycena rosella]